MESFVRADQITKRYENTLALDHVSFTINGGRCIGLLGVNGAGKTTTLRILSGLIKSTSGNIYYEGQEISKDSLSFLYKKKIGFLSQYPKFYDWMTGYEFLSYIYDLYGLDASGKKERIYGVLKIVNLEGSEKRKIKGYSGGMKQRLGIAQAILHKPSFLILDEPVSALDPEGRHQIIKLLEKLKKDTTILLSTHILHDADSICDDVIILHKGKKIIETELTALKKEHQEPLIKIAFTKDPYALIPVLEKYEWIESITNDDFTMEIKVTEKETALRLLPKIFTDKDYLFTSFEVFEPTLEDIFLKLVSQ